MKSIISIRAESGTGWRYVQSGSASDPRHLSRGEIEYLLQLVVPAIGEATGRRLSMALYILNRYLTMLCAAVPVLGGILHMVHPGA